MPKNRSWTDDQLRAAVPLSRSYAQVLARLGLQPGGGTYVSLRRHITRLGLSTEHFTGQGWNKEGPPAEYRFKAIPLSEILVRNSSYQDSNKLKKRLIKGELLREKCAICGLPPEWQGERLVLRLDHINGDRTDHRLDNLRLLCPNCDSQTDTFAGRNKGWRKRSRRPSR